MEWIAFENTWLWGIKHISISWKLHIYTHTVIFPKVILIDSSGSSQVIMTLEGKGEKSSQKLTFWHTSFFFFYRQIIYSSTNLHSFWKYMQLIVQSWFDDAPIYNWDQILLIYTLNDASQTATAHFVVKEIFAWWNTVQRRNKWCCSPKSAKSQELIAHVSKAILNLAVSTKDQSLVLIYIKLITYTLHLQALLLIEITFRMIKWKRFLFALSPPSPLSL